MLYVYYIWWLYRFQNSYRFWFRLLLDSDSRVPGLIHLEFNVWSIIDFFHFIYTDFKLFEFRFFFSFFLLTRIILIVNQRTDPIYFIYIIYILTVFLLNEIKERIVFIIYFFNVFLFLLLLSQKITHCKHNMIILLYIIQGHGGVK